jgi:hypothetical protein
MKKTTKTSAAVLAESLRKCTGAVAVTVTDGAETATAVKLKPTMRSLAISDCLKGLLLAGDDDMTAIGKVICIGAPAVEVLLALQELRGGK